MIAMSPWLLFTPPLLVLLLCHRPWQAMLNLLLTFLGFWPGVIHACLILYLTFEEEHAYQATSRFVRHVKRAQRENPDY